MVLIAVSHRRNQKRRQSILVRFFLASTTLYYMLLAHSTFGQQQNNTTMNETKHTKHTMLLQPKSSSPKNPKHNHHDPHRIWMDEQRQRLRTYDPRRFPIIPKKKKTRGKRNSKQLSIALIQQQQDTANININININTHILSSAIQQSKVLRSISLAQALGNRRTNISKIVHMIDWASFQYDCHALHLVYSNATRRNDSPILLDDHHQLVYWDSGSLSAPLAQRSCPSINRLFATTTSSPRIVQQSIVQGRHWNPTKQWIDPGSIPFQSNRTTTPTLYAPIHHNTRQNVLAVNTRKHAPASDNADSPLQHQVDILFYQTSPSTYYSRFQQSIWNRLNQTIHNESWTMQIYNHTASNHTISAKILLVIGADEWDTPPPWDVMAQNPTTLVVMPATLAPPRYWHNGTHFASFASWNGLLRAVRYYVRHANERLRMAKQGHRVAIQHYRPHHVLERMLFGTQQSN